MPQLLELDRQWLSAIVLKVVLLFSILQELIKKTLCFPFNELFPFMLSFSKEGDNYWKYILQPHDNRTESSPRHDRLLQSQHTGYKVPAAS